MSITLEAIRTAVAPVQNEVISCDQLKDLFDQVMEERSETTDKIKWIDDETVEVSGVSGACMHQFALRAEELGKEVSYQKKIFIKISDK